MRTSRFVHFVGARRSLMPLIGRDRWRVLGPLLDRALELPDEELAAFLGELRSVSPGVAAELSAILSGEAAADREGFLAAPIGAATLRLARLTTFRRTY